MPYCVHCGAEVSPQATACPACGKPTSRAPATATTVTPGARPVEGFAIASLACSIGGVFLVPIIGSILGIVFASVARRNLRDHPEREGSGLALAGLIVGWMGLILMILAFALILAWVWAWRDFTF
jgi:hypothetical protein